MYSTTFFQCVYYIMGVFRNAIDFFKNMIKLYGNNLILEMLYSKNIFFVLFSQYLAVDLYIQNSTQGVKYCIKQPFHRIDGPLNGPMGKSTI